ncbi:MAG: hypothetical protein PHI96_05350 [Desulfovibrio sp.]|nr:hypothetical protein [Desulfovibrio sp.]
MPKEAKAREISVAAETDMLLDTTVNDKRIAHLLEKADGMTRSLAGNRGFIWTAIGIDSTPCDMGCSFCSHAARWDAYKTSPPLSEEEIVEKAGQLADGGADFVVLRTTQHYPLEVLQRLGRLTRDRIGSDMHLVINTGEMSLDTVRALKDSGYSMSYHVVRLREGQDTGHSVDMRMRTIENVLRGGLELQYLIEPLGPEHSAQEILAEARRARAVGASGTGVMARVPIMGTPLAQYGQVSDTYLKRVTAAARLEYPDGGQHLCVHPPTPQTLHCGANTMIVEEAANPRDTSSSSGPWRAFDLPRARAVMREAGLAVRPAKAEG